MGGLDPNRYYIEEMDEKRYDYSSRDNVVVEEGTTGTYVEADGWQYKPTSYSSNSYYDHYDDRHRRRGREEVHHHHHHHADGAGTYYRKEDPSSWGGYRSYYDPSISDKGGNEGAFLGFVVVVAAVAIVGCCIFKAIEEKKRQERITNIQNQVEIAPKGAN